MTLVRPRNVLERSKQLREYMEHVYAFVNGKGGVGKTSSTVNVAATLAKDLEVSGLEGRVLIVELDPQGNVGRNLGYRGTGLDDQGRGLEAAILRGDQPYIIRDVRPRLDVIPCGLNFQGVELGIVALTNQLGDAAWLRLAEVVAALAGDYEWIFFDCPPGSQNIQRLALTATRWVISPLDFSAFARDGLEYLAQQVGIAAEHNPDLELLGVLLYNFETERVTKKGEAAGQVVRVREATRVLLREFGLEDRVFKTYIRKGTSVMEQCQNLGRTLLDLQGSNDAISWLQARRGEPGLVLATGRASILVEDFISLAAEIIDRRDMLEAEFMDEQDAQIPHQADSAGNAVVQ